MKPSCGTLCQHPGCWRADLKKAKEAVRARNGIFTADEDSEYAGSRDGSTSQDKGDALPTLKVIDVFSGINQPVANQRLPALGVHQRSNSLPSLLPGTTSFSRSLSQSPTLHTPRPSPTTPAVMTDYQKKMLWKQRLNTVEALCTEHGGEGVIHRVGIHEIFDQDELRQDWQDVYITSAYLVWCPPAKSQRRRKTCKSSPVKKVVPKDMTEDMVPAAMETLKQQRPRQRKPAAGVLSHSPSRGAHRNPDTDQHELSRDFVTKVELAQDSVIAPPQFQSSPRLEPEEPRGLELRLDKPSDVGSKVLLDVDIKSRFASPEEANRLQNLEEDLKLPFSEWPPSAAPAEASKEEGEDKTATRQVRIPLHLSSIGVPTEDLPPVSLHHCPNSIPRNMPLAASLEPVDLVSVTPSPTATPLETTIPQVQSQRTTRPHSSLFVNIPSEHDSVYDNPLYHYFPIRGHMTSAMRFSPNPVSAPAPTPISPDRQTDGSHDFRQHSRISQRPRGRKFSSHSTRINSDRDSAGTWRVQRRATFCGAYGAEEALAPGRCSPIGQEWPSSPGHVFITEEQSDLMPTSPEHSRQEWLGGTMMVSATSETNMALLRSPSPGSKTFIPQDILAEFQGDPYGKHAKFVHGSLLADTARGVITLPDQQHQLENFVSTSSSPGWRLPRSRTPIQLSETVGRTAPKPLRQPPAESVPKSLTVKHLPASHEVRPKSTPPRVTSRGVAAQQVLSETSLVTPAPGRTSTYSLLDSFPPGDDVGPMPPPPSPEPSVDQSRLEALSEVDESGSVVLGNGVRKVTDTPSEVNDTVETEGKRVGSDVPAGTDAPTQQDIEHDIGDVGDDRTAMDLPESGAVLQPISCENIDDSDKTETSTSSALPSAPATETNMLAQSVSSPVLPASSNSGNGDGNHGPLEPDQAGDVQSLPGSLEADAVVCKMDGAQNLNDCAESEDPGEELPRLTASPELELAQSDFSEGLDMNLDLEKELKMAMEGLDDLEVDVTRNSPES